MISPIPPLHVKVKADHSCNWKCCFGCRDQETSDSTRAHPNTPDSVVERTQHVVEKHWHKSPPTSSIMPRTVTVESEDS